MRTLIALSVLLLGAADADASELTELVQSTLLQHALAAYPEADVDITVQDLDPRLKLGGCADLRAEPRGQNAHGRVHVALTCSQPRPWRAYVSAVVRVSVPVLTARGDLVRGALIRPADVTIARKELSGLRAPPMLALPENGRYAARRHIPAGTVMSLNVLQPLPAIAKGDVVQLEARVGNASIHTQARALSAGHVGQQIRVENLRSGRVVRGWVVRAGRVSTRPQRKTPANATQIANRS